MDDYEQEIDGQWYSDTERALHLKAWEMSSIENLLKAWAEKAGAEVLTNVGLFCM